MTQGIKDEPVLAFEKTREIGKLLDSIIPYRDGHSQRVCEYSLAIAEELKFSRKEIAMIESAALLHDLGKVAVAEWVLNNPLALSKVEKEEIKKHTMIGYIMLAGFTDIPQILYGVKNHHEFWNGSGYPDGLGYWKIPLNARIVSVADAYDAMTSNRPYRSVYSKEAATIELERCSGIQFDPEIVNIFLEILDARF